MARNLQVFVAVFTMSVSAATAAPITSLFVFGDSLSDDGNAFILTGGFPVPPYAERVSNGPVAVERLADRLGVPLSPSAEGGTDYAVGGATTGTDNFAAIAYGLPALDDTGMLSQALAFALSGAIFDADESLFVVWGGPNDFFLDPSAAAAATAVTNLATTIGLLYDAGARRFLVPNMPDLSLTPSGRSLPLADQAALRALSIGFNTGLATALDGLDLFPGIDITRFDTFTLLAAIAENPAAFGFANATDACFSGGLGTPGVVCADPDSYVFWDSVHPTAAAHAAVGDAFAQAVPEPATMALLGFGLVWQIARRARVSGAYAVQTYFPTMCCRSRSFSVQKYSMISVVGLKR